MKNIVTTFILIVFSWGASSSQSTLQVNIEDCRGDLGFTYLAEFFLFKNDKLVKTVRPGLDNEQKIMDLDHGKYKIEYKTIFERIECVDIELTEDKEYNIDLCLNAINYASESYLPIIDQIKNDEFYSIQISSKGCFHRSDEKIIIKREKYEFYLNFGEQEKLLSNDDIEAIRRFEIELNHMESEGCTTTDSYFIKYNNEEVKISDGSCIWKGGYYLKKKLGLTID